MVSKMFKLIHTYMGLFLCIFGKHRWIYTGNKSRTCYHCNLQQEYCFIEEKWNVWH
jgi:hypothetical protein